MKLCATILVAVLALSACKREMEFNHRGWTIGADAGFPPPARSFMLSDLLTRYKLVGMSYPAIVELLGRPDDTDCGRVLYEIELDYRTDIDPVYWKNLMLYLNDDSVVTAYEIKEEDLSQNR